jgi:hypothetical protein
VSTLDPLRAVARQLGDLRERVVFVGGMIRSLLVTDPAAGPARPTVDVDVIVDVPTPSALMKLYEELRAVGFRESHAEGAPICRWNAGGVSVDIMPLDPAILGFSNVWYPSGFANATTVALHHVIDRVRCVQDILGMPLALENPSSYLELVGSSMKEWEFLGRVAEEADCALLLDVNNVFVSGYNHGYDPLEYLAAVPYDRVVQLHVAGHTHRGTHIVDSHIGPVHVDVWRLLRDAYARSGGVSILLEWDADIPGFAETHAEALRAKDFIDGCAA